jgi:hypothetical protein
VRVHRTGRITGATVTHTCQMRTVATFRLIGAEQGHTASAATARLGVQPSRAYEAGTPVRPGSDKIREVSGWYLDSGGPAYGVELAAQLHRLLYVLEPVAAPVWELVEAGYWANWFCYLGSYPAEHAAELDRATPPTSSAAARRPLARRLRLTQPPVERLAADSATCRDVFVWYVDLRNRCCFGRPHLPIPEGMRRVAPARSS